MTSDSDSIKDIDSLDIYKKALDNLGEFLEPSELVQSDLQNVQNQSEVSDESSDESRVIPKSSNDKKPKISEFEEIFNRLLVIFTARDRVQKSLLANVLENPSTVEIEIHQLDKQLRNNLRTINSKINPKIKFDIMSSLAEFKAQRAVSSNDWWWNYHLDLGWRYWRIWRWRYWRIWKWLPFLCLGFSAVILYKIIYGLTTGQILIQANSIYNVVTVVGTALGTILGFIGLQDIISGQIKDFASSRWQEVNQSSFFKVKSFNRPAIPLLWSFGSFVTFVIVYVILPNIFNYLAVGEGAWSPGVTFKEIKNNLERAAYLNPGNKIIRKNLAKFYLYNGDYGNAAKEYKALLPDFEATIELLRLHLLKLDKDNSDHSNYNDYTAYLAYELNSSYFSAYCDENDKIEGRDKGNSWLKALATKTTKSTINGCKLGIYGDNYFQLNENQDAYLIFLGRAFEFLKMRGHINLIQGQYYQANLDLESAQNLADKTIKTIQKQMTEDENDLITKEDLAIRSIRANTEGCNLGVNKPVQLRANILVRSAFNGVQGLITRNNEKFCNDKVEELIDRENIPNNADRLLAVWERRKAESACLLVQSLKKLKPTNEKKRLSYEKKCYDYSPRYSEDWNEWGYEYSRWYKPNWLK
jgi:hypothetical protein